MLKIVIDPALKSHDQEIPILFFELIEHGVTFYRKNSINTIKNNKVVANNFWQFNQLNLSLTT